MSIGAEKAEKEISHRGYNFRMYVRFIFEFAIDSVVAKKKKKKDSVRGTNKAAREWKKDRQIREKDGTPVSVPVE